MFRDRPDVQSVIPNKTQYNKRLCMITLYGVRAAIATNLDEPIPTLARDPIHLAFYLTATFSVDV